MTQKIILAKPTVRHPIKKQGSGGDVGIPLSFLYLAAYVRETNETDISIVDYRLDRAMGKDIDPEKDFSGIDIVGTGACTSEAPEAMKIMKKAKEMGKITVIGGIYPTLNAEEVLNSGSVDFVVRGEGEKTLSDLLKALDGKMSLNDVKGISYLRDGKIINHEDQDLITIDELPLPAYDLVSMEDYAKFTEAAVYAARGCPMKCNFCTINKHWRYRYRTRSVESVVEEIKALKGFGFERVHFKDESMMLNKEWSTELFKELERLNLGVKYKAKARIDQIDEELVQTMVNAGLDMIHFGVESVSQKSLLKMLKGTKKEEIRRAFDILLNNGCGANPVYMFSWPGETKEDLQENVRFIEEMGSLGGVRTYVSFITPHPNSGLSVDSGLNIFTTDYSKYTHKLPVAVPRSLGLEGLDLMVDAYNHIAEVTSTERWNPKVDKNYLQELKEAKNGN